MNMHGPQGRDEKTEDVKTEDGKADEKTEAEKTDERFAALSEMCRRAARQVRQAELLRGSEKLLVVSHVDADGLTSAAIACTALKRLGLEYQPMFFRQLDPAALEEVSKKNADLVIFTDLGSGMIDRICELGLQAVIADHHRPAACECQSVAHINPHLVGADGAVQISGSGTTFLLARALSETPGGNDDLAALAIVGAVGDLQDMARGQLVGINRLILEIGSEAGVLSYSRDIKLFGRQTRPVYKMLEYSQDPYIPGLSGNEDACIAFLKEIGIRAKGESWRRWIDLSHEEKALFVTAIIRKGLRNGLSGVKLERLIGEVYVLLSEREGTELRDASEYSTLLNATARYGHATVGLSVCMGDRDKAFAEAQRLLAQHRNNLVNGLKLVAERGITRLTNIQYFDSGDAILDTIVGIVAGMSFQMADRSLPILALARTGEGELKVSARGTQELVRSGLDLADAMSKSASAVGGIGGGHNVAAGATIPPEAREEFLGLVDRSVGMQMKDGAEK